MFGRNMIVLGKGDGYRTAAISMYDKTSKPGMCRRMVIEAD